MKSTIGRNEATPRPIAVATPPRRRFRIEKLEERIAPSKGGKGTHNCGGGSTSSGLGGSASIF
jgi:hypothetical protein